MNVIGNALHEKMRSQGAETYKKFLCSEIIHNWKKIVDESIAAQVRPVKIEHGVLFVNVENSSFKDQLKFCTEEILDTINDGFGQENQLVKEIRIVKGFQIAELTPEKIAPAQDDKPEIAIEEIILTDEEIKRCEEKAKRFSDAKIRQSAYNTLLAHARAKKLQLANGWHKCEKCDTLCPPTEIFCEPCKIKSRNDMVEELYKIFYDEPWTNTRDAQKILLERMPQMRGECLPEAVESARTTLIQKVAGKVRFGDEDSPDVLKLVMLEKRLPPDKITPAIIKRTLIDLQFNLSEQPKLLRYAQKVSRK